ncbi:MAG TPA: glycosyltransferase family A protein [Candidatus Sulfotelmatobacter sp.]|nr:glycosyltransferase family A protein [Candidatus Sulfotelmatobacter sp.]
MAETAFSVSVIITNYNYAEFVGAAIESALHLDWSDVEVIVVDDGSTDASRDVIARYADRITVILQENSGQLVACNRAFSASRGDVVIFLDSDDLLAPSLIREIAAIWRPGISKVQVQMQTIDAGGKFTGSIFPQYRVPPSPDQIRLWYTRTADYPTPPGSGNAYARWFLEKIFPLDDRCGSATDTCCIIAAPVFGDVVTIAKPLVSYRVHGRNQGAMSSLNVERFAREVARAQLRSLYAHEVAKTGGLDVPRDAIRRSLWLLPYRIASIKLAPRAHPIVGDRMVVALADGLRGAMVPQGRTKRARVILTLWSILVALLPSAIARTLILWRLSSVTRPPVLQWLLRGFRVVAAEPASRSATAPTADAATWPPPPLATAAEGLSVSVVIPNYNYGDYIGAAIQSALDLDWPSVEVVVVDDGSTDNSRSVIESFGSRVRAIFQANGGQRRACNAGFAATTGDVVIFLDSDDVLAPTLLRELAAVWAPGISKVQFQMQTIDAKGRPLGTCLPQFDVTPAPHEIRQWAQATGTYPTPPGSGNAYARWFLDRLFPLDDSCGEFSDSCCLMAAPYLGDVVTVAKPLVSYRVHGRNDFAMTDLDVPRLAREVARALQRFAYSRRIAESVGFALPAGAIRRSLHLLPYRVASLRLAPAKHPMPEDTIATLLLDAIRAVACPQGTRLRARLLMLVWTAMVGLSPSALATTLVHWRFVPAERPPALRGVLRQFGIVR